MTVRIAAVILAAVTFLSLTVPSGGGGGEGRLFWESDGEGGLWLWVDPPLGELGGGDAVAVSMTVQISTMLPQEDSGGGGRWEITPCEGAEGLTLTVGEALDGGDTRKLLLDGYPTSTSGRLLRLQVPDLCDKGDGACPFGVKWLAVDGLYGTDGGGSIKKIPLSAEDHVPSRGDGMAGGETDAESGVDTDTAAETAADTAADTVEGLPTDSAEETLCQSEAVRPPTVFLGCQETPVTDGSYGVRFLFYGATPVLRVEGGGFLRGEIATVYVEGKTCSACTLRGLRAEEDYTFLVYTRGGWVEVKYRGGEFLGFFC